MTCFNCGASHGCGCQARIASDGKNCCNSCIASYEIQIYSKLTQPQTNTGQAPVINSIVFNNVNT